MQRAGSITTEDVTADGPTVVLSATGISKRFGGITALSDVSLDLRPGEVHA
ncbi:MAG: ABC transporter ATP-binding protein, partial [Mesorhizobium sp.]